MMPRDILDVLPGQLREIIAQLPDDLVNQVEEIRLRQNKPLMLGLAKTDTMITSLGQPTSTSVCGYVVTEQDMNRTVQLISGSSIYAFEEEIRNGFITIKGGHRVGICGKTVLEKGAIKTIKFISGLDIRVAREIKGCGDRVLPYLIDPVYKEFLNTLVISPPRCGKTTLIRDVARQLSDGINRMGIKGVTVGLVDERSELAGCYRGVPQKDVGLRTDVLDGCPKAIGMMMLIRSMGPQIIVTDEIGRQEDLEALEEALNAGIKVLTTVHGANIDDINQRPVMQCILKHGIFKRIVILGRSRGVGTIENIIDTETNKDFTR